MKRKLITLFAVFVCATMSFAQTTFKRGTNVISLGVGLGSSYYGSGYSMNVPPLSASYEYGIVDKLFNNGKGAIGVGGLVGYTSSKWKYKSNFYSVNYLTFAARGNLHYEFVNNLDTYAGLTLGYYGTNHSAPDEFWDGDSGELALGLNVGARYYFSPNIAAMAELGYGIAILNLGVSFKF